MCGISLHIDSIASCQNRCGTGNGAIPMTVEPRAQCAARHGVSRGGGNSNVN
jgi:hypothetical protein